MLHIMVQQYPLYKCVFCVALGQISCRLKLAYFFHPPRRLCFYSNCFWKPDRSLKLVCTTTVSTDWERVVFPSFHELYQVVAVGWAFWEDAEVFLRPIITKCLVLFLLRGLKRSNLPQFESTEKQSCLGHDCFIFFNVYRSYQRRSYIKVVFLLGFAVRWG